jgi:hypothetical protein
MRIAHRTDTQNSITMDEEIENQPITVSDLEAAKEEVKQAVGQMIKGFRATYPGVGISIYAATVRKEISRGRTYPSHEINVTISI